MRRVGLARAVVTLLSSLGVMVAVVCLTCFVTAVTDNGLKGASYSWLVGPLLMAMVLLGLAICAFFAGLGILLAGQLVRHLLGASPPAGPRPSHGEEPGRLGQ